MNEHFWWYLSRASGVVAWALATLCVLWGMALSTRALGRQPRAPWLLDLHRFLGGTTVLFVLLHMVSLVPDSYTEFGPAELVVPGASEWKPGAVASGIIAMYLLVAIEVSSLLMKHLPKKVWRAVHLCSYAVYVLATAHFLAAGTDAKLAGVRTVAIGSGALILFFLAYQLIGPGKAASVRSSGAGAAKQAEVPSGGHREAALRAARAKASRNDAHGRDSTGHRKGSNGQGGDDQDEPLPLGTTSS